MAVAVVVAQAASSAIASPPPEIVVDINRTGSNSASPGAFAQAGDTVYFQARDAEHGVELWKSDGTTTGTILVKDISPSTESSSPFFLAAVGETIFFAADNGENGEELWRSDGTAAGTSMVEDINPGLSSSSPSNLTRVGDEVFFSADDGVRGTALWKSDGTASGTVLVADPNSRTTSHTFGDLLGEFTAMNGDLYFTASDGNAGPYGRELWRSDGTEAGTALVKDINVGSGSASPSELTRVGDTLFFRANGSADESGLWKTDGTESGTLFIESSQPNDLTAVGNTLFFGGDDGHLWRSDGTDDGTNAVTTVAPGGAYALTAVGGTLFFATRTGTPKLWTSNGTDAGTTPVTSFPGVGEPHVYRAPMALGERLVYVADDLSLWTSDGTEEGTTRLAGIAAHGGYSLPEGTTRPPLFGELDGRLLISADDGIIGTELWRSDGTVAGTKLVSNIDKSADSSPDSLVDMGGTLFFTADDGTAGRELWKSDGSGAVRVADVRSGGEGSSPQDLTEVGGTLFFTADDGTAGRELWKSDGTETGTTLVAEIKPGTSSSSPDELIAVGETLFFGADDGVNGRELWRSDGTSSGTTIVKDIWSGPSGSSGVEYVDWWLPTVLPYRFFRAGDALYFVATDGTSGRELWRSDGTDAGTTRVADINPGTGSSEATDFFAVGPMLYFSAHDGEHGVELWRSDGTAAGTAMVVDIWPNKPFVESSAPSGFADLAGMVLFAANDGVNGRELWRSDGTAVGTAIAKDVNPGLVVFPQASFPASSHPSRLVADGDRVFFNAATESHGRELWRSDGTPGGTAMVADLAAGSQNGLSFDGRIVRSGATLFFVADDLTHGVELWRLRPRSSSPNEPPPSPPPEELPPILRAGDDETSHEFKQRSLLGTLVPGRRGIVRGRKLVLTAICRGANLCRGVARVLARPRASSGKRRPAGRQLIAHGRYYVGTNANESVRLTLTKAGLRLVSRGTRLTGRVFGRRVAARPIGIGASR